MEVNLAVLADYANRTDDGKMNIMGIFSDVDPPSLPFVLTSMFLVILFDASPDEIGQTKPLAIVLRDSDGREMLRLNNEAAIPPPPRPGGRAQVNIVLGLMGLRFERVGDYEFSVLVSEEEKRIIPVRVNAPPGATVEEV
jgi:hypothetical protein